MKTIGVLGGMGPQATMDFGHHLHAVAQRLLPQHQNTGYPPMVTVFLRHSPVELSEAGTPRAPLALDPRVLVAAKRLGAWADLVVMPSNMPHLFLDDIEAAAGCEVLSIIDVTVDELRRRGAHRVGLTGFGVPEVYRRRLIEDGYDIVTARAALRAKLDDAILRLMEGSTTEEHRRAALAAVDDVRAAGAESTVLACTEIPLLLRELAEGRDLVNPVQLLAEAAVRNAAPNLCQSTQCFDARLGNPLHGGIARVGRSRPPPRGLTGRGLAGALGRHCRYPTDQGVILMNIEQLRSETPGCEERTHLNNAGSALMPAPVVRTIQEHIALESRIGGYEAADARSDAVRAAYRSVADLIGAQPGNIAFTENATVSYLQALSSIPFERGDVILATRNDYVSNQIQLLSLQARIGVQVVRAPDRPDGGVDVSAMADLIRQHRPTLVCVTHVPTNSGLVQDVRTIGSVCRDEGVLYLLDACQSIGQMPIHVRELACDFLTATSRKFLRGPRGSGFLYVSDQVLERGFEPLFLDLRGADWIAPDAYRASADARRFENWEFAWALVLATGEAARYASAIGLGEIRDRVGVLASRLREALGAIETVRVLDRGEELSSIVSVWIDGRDPDELVESLRRRRINTSAQVRAYALIDCDDKGVTGSLRLSPHYYNTEDEIDEVVSAIRETVKSKE